MNYQMVQVNFQLDSFNFNRGEHVVAAFPDVEKTFDNVWHNGLRFKNLFHLQSIEKKDNSRAVIHANWQLTFNEIFIP